MYIYTCTASRNIFVWDILRETVHHNLADLTDATELFCRMAELLERETEEYYKMDPDPFDDRHPGRAVPTCALGHLMKTLFKNEDFMNKVKRWPPSICFYLLKNHLVNYSRYLSVCYRGTGKELVLNMAVNDDLWFVLVFT